MNAYLVRLIEDHQIVGFFVAPDIDTLRELVDECTDVPECEYVEIGPGGVYWSDKSFPIPRSYAGLTEDEPPALAEAELSEGWSAETFADPSGDGDILWMPLSLLADIPTAGSG